MKTLKLVISILATVLGGLVFLQSCVVSVGEELEGLGAVDSGAGLFMSLILVAVGVVGICTRKKVRWICLILGVVYGLVGNIGIQNAESFPGLEIWGGISFVFAVIYIIVFFIEVSSPKNTDKID